MGLDTSHDCWHGAYSAFHRWRKEIARVAGLPPLELMKGFYSPLSKSLSTFFCGDYEKSEYYFSSLNERLPISWNCLRRRPLNILLRHSDYNGVIPWRSCGPIARELEALIPLLADEDAGGHIGNWREKTQKFVDGLRLASSLKESVHFH